jgi:soluble P-type ATPase
MPKRTIGSPGVKGAVKDLVNAVGMELSRAAPASVRERKAKLQQQEDAALGRMREGQSTDSNNRY